MEFVQIKRRVHGKYSSFWCLSAILQSGLILENIRRIVLLSIWGTVTMYMNFDEKHSPNVLANRTRLQNSAYTTRKNLSFRVLCALFEPILSGIIRDTVELRRLEHRWLVYHGLFEVIFESLRSFSNSSRTHILRKIFIFYYEIVCCVY